MIEEFEISEMKSGKELRRGAREGSIVRHYEWYRDSLYMYYVYCYLLHLLITVCIRCELRQIPDFIDRSI